MKCPYCGYTESKVIDSRPTDDSTNIRRRRECINCGLVDDIEQKLSNSLDKEIPSSVIGEYVMDGLRNLDEVAYVRFASVYRQFKDVNSFMDELQRLIKEK